MLRWSLACRAGISFIKFWSLTLPLYHPQVAMATAHTFEIVEGESGGRLFAVSITQDKVSHREWFGGFPTTGYRTCLCFVFKPGDQHVDSRSDSSSNRIPDLDRLRNAIKIVIKC